MDQAQIVRDFVDTLGKMSPPIIDGSLLKNYLKNIVVDSKSLEEFITYSDRYLKHSQTFQMSFLLHSLASVLKVSPLGNPVHQVLASVKTHVFDIPHQEIIKIEKMDEAERYSQMCSFFMDFESKQSKSLEGRLSKERNDPNLEKIDDGTTPDAIFDPMGTMFPIQAEPGEDLTEELEIKD